jgi:hypothetical protein
MYAHVPMAAPVCVDAGVLGCAGDTEVDEVGEVVAVEQDVWTFDRPGEPAPPGGRCCSAEAICSMIDTARIGSSGPGRSRLQVGAVDQPHRDVQPAVDLADVVDRYDVRIVQSRGGARLAPEPLVEFGVLGVVGSSIFSATTRSMAVSCARHTSPMPPRPSNSISR